MLPKRRHCLKIRHINDASVVAGKIKCSSTVTVLCTFLSLLPNVSPVSLHCDPAEEGSVYSLTVDTPCTRRSVTWRFRNKAVNADRTICNCFPSCAECPLPAVFQSVDRETLTIDTAPGAGINVETNYTWSCTDTTTNPVVASCDLQIYRKPVTPSCEHTFVNNNADLKLKCSTSKVYPTALCQFQWRRMGSQGSWNTIDSTTIHYTHVDMAGTGPTYYRSECSINVDVTNFEPGQFEFQINMYPNVSGGNQYYTSGSTIVQFTKPTATLASDCPNGPYIKDGYIMSGKQANCICERTSPGYPPGLVNWFRKDGQTDNVNINDGSATLTVTYDSNDPVQEYSCSVISVFGTFSTNVTYKPKFAYGPSAVEVKSERNIYTLCPTAEVKVTCQTSPETTNPTPQLILYAGKLQLNQSTAYEIKATFSPSNSGTQNLRCEGRNSKFPTGRGFNAVSSTVIDVQEPPKEAPQILFKGEEAATTTTTTTAGQTVTEGQVVNVTCEVKGGHPAVTNRTLSCGSHTAQNGHLTLLNMTRSFNGQSCTCQANHVTGCYQNNTATVKVNVLYGASIQGFTVNSSTSIEVKSGSTVPFVCQADGNPTPVLSVWHRNSPVLTMSQPGNLTSESPALKCQDTGQYSCRANNGINSPTVSQPTGVSVLCTYQLNQTETQQMYTGKVNQTFAVNVSIFGYPEPSNNNLVGNKTGPRNSSDVKYIKLDPPYGIVNMKFHLSDENMFQNYTLTVANTQGKLVFEFQILSESSDRSEKTGNDDVNIGAVVGGVVAGVVVISIVAVVLVVKVKGLPCRMKNNGSRNTQTYTLSSTTKSVPSYENVLHDSDNVETPETSPQKNRLHGGYENVLDLNADSNSRSHSGLSSHVVVYENTV